MPEFIREDKRNKNRELDQQAALESRAQKFLEYPKDPELLGLLEKIDFNLLGNIFREVGRSCGINGDKINFLNPERIAHISINAGTLAELASELNIIAVDPREFKKYMEERGLPIDLALLAIVVHEEAHAVSRRVCEEFGSGKEVRVGYEHSMRPDEMRMAELLGGKAKTVFEVFNEGVTEKFAEEVFLEYIRRSSYININDAEVFLKNYRQNASNNLSLAKALVDTLIQRIGRETEINQKLVWQSLVRGLFEAESFIDEELRVLFAEMFSPDFLRRLSRLPQDKKEMKRMEGEIKGKSIRALITYLSRKSRWNRK